MAKVASLLKRGGQSVHGDFVVAPVVADAVVGPDLAAFGYQQANRRPRWVGHALLLRSVPGTIRAGIRRRRANKPLDAATHARLVANGQIVFRYCDAGGEVTGGANPNGSFDNIAGICDERGNVLGLMPHPERASEDLLGGADGLLVLKALDTRLARQVLSSVSDT